MEYEDRNFIGPSLDVYYEEEPMSYRGVPSLQDLCGEKIVSDSFLIRNCIDFVPSKIRTFIMEKAFAEGRYPTICCLLKNWPYREFCFPQLPILRNWRLACSFQNWYSFSKRLRNAVDCSTTVLNVFLQAIHNNCWNTKLKFLDLSAIPLSEKSTLKICYAISDKSLSFSSLAGEGHTNGTEKFTIKVHCTVGSIEGLEALHHALTTGKLGISPIRLSIYALRFSGIPLCKRFIDLLNLIDPVDLEIFSFGFAHVCDNSLLETLLCLQRFHNLRVLGFDYCHVRGENFNYIYHTMQELFRRSVHISRLDLSNCNLGSNFTQLLMHVNKKKVVYADVNSPVINKKLKSTCSSTDCQNPYPGSLEYLNLSGCCLSASNLEYLAGSQHAWTLKNLNLNYCNLGNQFNSVVALLRALTHSLCVLEMACTYIRDEDIREFFSVLKNMQKLRFLNIANIRAAPNIQFQLLPELCTLPFLKYLCLSVPPTVPPLEMRLFREQVVNLIKNKGQNVDVVWLG